MFLKIRKKNVYIIGLLPALLFLNILPLHAEGNNASSSLSNPVVDVLIVLMIVLLIVIAMLGKLLLDVAEVKWKKEQEEKKTTGIVITSTIALLLFSSAIQAQTSDVATSATTIAGMTSFVFYTIMTIVFLELFVILGLLFNIRSLLRKEQEKTEEATAIEAVKKPAVTLWSKLNRFKPVEQEADIDLGHDYDGIRELDNRLPPWWLYGFYLTIVVSVIYLWRFHVSHTGPSSKEEYETAVASAAIEIKAYLEKKGDAVDENTVTVLTSTDDIAAGKAIFLKSCAACHKETGGGDVGPNLTDNYWLHGGDIKSVFKTIRYGINAMPEWQSTYSNKQIAQVAGFVKSLQGTWPPNSKPVQGELYNEEDAVNTPDSTANKSETSLK